MALLASLLTACGLNPPDPIPFVERCETVPVSMPSSGGVKHFFWLSSALPDCRDDAVQLANYRYPQETFGTGSYEVLAADDVQTPDLTLNDATDWREALGNAIARPGNEGRLIVFIHGYATSFDEAHMDGTGVRELAGEDPPLVVLHWPSRDSAADYLRDRSSVLWAQDTISDTLAELSLVADDITVVTHSMGAQAGTRAVLALESRQDARPQAIKRLVFASPDYDRHLAVRPGGTLDKLLRYERDILVYASARDRALQLSGTANGYARLGSTRCADDLDYERSQRRDDQWCHLVMPRKGLAIVETGPSDAEGLLRHNDFLKSCQVREDLAAFLRGEEPPQFRTRIEEDGLVGYKIDPLMEYEGSPCQPMKG